MVCSFDDTMDVVGKHVEGEPDSSEEEEAENNRSGEKGEEEGEAIGLLKL